ncbi:MAG: alkaline phosphatase [Mangrovibacterium sp.]
MNRIFLFSLTFLISSMVVFGQNNQKAASGTNSFLYDQPYDIVRVKPIKDGHVKNVILMIGDGMGLSQVSAAWVANRGKLNLDNCSYTGFSRTWCANKLITDSGAAGTAMATGKKAAYHSISVDMQGNPLSSLTDLARGKGLKTGIVVTCGLYDATPAAFCANNADRDQEEEIAAGYLDCQVDYIFGGGRDKFSKRSDRRNLLTEMKQKGYQVYTNWDETRRLLPGRVICIPEEGQLPLARERGDLFAKASLQAIQMLDNNKGFFAMLEGSRIDDCGHWNDLPKLIDEVLDFDRSIGEVLKWAEKDGETLVIVLADHETGGLILLDGDLKSGSVTGSFSSKEHSGILVPVYAYGPGAEEFSGIYENTEIFYKITQLLHIK